MQAWAKTREKQAKTALLLNIKASCHHLLCNERRPIMMKLRKFVLASLMIATAGAGMASATDYSKLRKDSRMHSELLGASVAYLIDEGCSDLSLRKMRLVHKAFSLRTHAISLGFSRQEVMAYVDSKTEQDRFRSIATPLLAKKGAVTGNEASYCAVGRAEMEKGSFAGSLLYAK